jgi:hypothetical protein
MISKECVVGKDAVGLGGRGEIESPEGERLFAVNSAPTGI